MPLIRAIIISMILSYGTIILLFPNNESSPLIAFILWIILIFPINKWLKKMREKSIEEEYMLKGYEEAKIEQYKGAFKEIIKNEDEKK